MNTSVYYSSKITPASRLSFPARPLTFNFRKENDLTFLPGDRVFVRLERKQEGPEVLAEFTLYSVAGLDDIYKELRSFTRGLRGLCQLYIRNLDRGWSVNRQLMLFSERRTVKTSLAS